MRTSSSTTSAVCDALIPCLRNFWPWLNPGVSRRDDERRLAAAAQFGIHRSDDDVHLGDASVGRPRLRAVEHPFVGGLVVARAGEDRADVRTGARLRGTEGRHLGVVDRAEHLRQPFAESARVCRRRPATAAASPVPRIDSAIPASPQNISSNTDEHAETRWLGGLLGEQLHRVQADLGRLLDDRPRRLFAFVPFRRRRPDHVGGELVHPVPDVDEVRGQLKENDMSRGPSRHDPR